MEQDLKTSGLSNLNPMKLWKNVLKSDNFEPVFLIIDNQPNKHDKLIKTLKQFPDRKIVIETPTFIDGLTTHNILYRSVGKTEEDPESLGDIDYIFCDKLDFSNWLPAGLSGITPLFTLTSLKQKLTEGKVPDKVERVENFEKTRNTLDNLLML